MLRLLQEFPQVPSSPLPSPLLLQVILGSSLVTTVGSSLDPQALGPLLEQGGPALVVRGREAGTTTPALLELLAMHLQETGQEAAGQCLQVVRQLLQLVGDELVSRPYYYYQW